MQRQRRVMMTYGLDVVVVMCVCCCRVVTVFVVDF